MPTIPSSIVTRVDFSTATDESNHYSWRSLYLREFTTCAYPPPTPMDAANPLGTAINIYASPPPSSTLADNNTISNTNLRPLSSASTEASSRGGSGGDAFHQQVRQWRSQQRDEQRESLSRRQSMQALMMRGVEAHDTNNTGDVARAVSPAMPRSYTTVAGEGGDLIQQQQYSSFRSSSFVGNNMNNNSFGASPSFFASGGDVHHSKGLVGLANTSSSFAFGGGSTNSKGLLVRTVSFGGGGLTEGAPVLSRRGSLRKMELAALQEEHERSLGRGRGAVMIDGGVPATVHYGAPHRGTVLTTLTSHNDAPLAAGGLGSGGGLSAAWWVASVAALRAASWPLLIDGTLMARRPNPLAGLGVGGDSARNPSAHVGDGGFVCALLSLFEERSTAIAEAKSDAFDEAFVARKNAETLNEENLRRIRWGKPPLKRLPRSMTFTLDHLAMARDAAIRLGVIKPAGVVAVHGMHFSQSSPLGNQWRDEASGSVPKPTFFTPLPPPAPATGALRDTTIVHDLLRPRPAPTGGANPFAHSVAPPSLPTRIAVDAMEVYRQKMRGRARRLMAPPATGGPQEDGYASTTRDTRGGFDGTLSSITGSVGGDAPSSPLRLAWRGEGSPPPRGYGSYPHSPSSPSPSYDYGSPLPPSIFASPVGTRPNSPPQATSVSGAECPQSSVVGGGHAVDLSTSSSPAATTPAAVPRPPPQRLGTMKGPSVRHHPPPLSSPPPSASGSQSSPTRLGSGGSVESAVPSITADLVLARASLGVSGLSASPRGIHQGLTGEEEAAHGGEEDMGATVLAAADQMALEHQHMLPFMLSISDPKGLRPFVDAFRRANPFAALLEDGDGACAEDSLRTEASTVDVALAGAGGAPHAPMPVFSAAATWREAVMRRRSWALSSFLFFLTRDVSYTDTHLIAMLSMLQEEVRSHVHCAASRLAGGGGPAGALHGAQPSTSRKRRARTSPGRSSIHSSLVASSSSSPDEAVGGLEGERDRAPMAGDSGTEGSALCASITASRFGAGIRTVPDVLSPAGSARAASADISTPSPTLQLTPECPLFLMEKIVYDIGIVLEGSCPPIVPAATAPVGFGMGGRAAPIPFMPSRTVTAFLRMINYFTADVIHHATRGAGGAGPPSSPSLVSAYPPRPRTLSEVEFNDAFLLVDWLSVRTHFQKSRDASYTFEDSIGTALVFAQTVEHRLWALKQRQQAQQERVAVAAQPVNMNSGGQTTLGSGIHRNGVGASPALLSPAAVVPIPVLHTSLLTTPLMLLVGYARPYVAMWIRPLVGALADLFNSCHVGSAWSLGEERKKNENIAAATAEVEAAMAYQNPFLPGKKAKGKVAPASGSGGLTWLERWKIGELLHVTTASASPAQQQHQQAALAKVRQREARLAAANSNKDGGAGQMDKEEGARAIKAISTRLEQGCRSSTRCTLFYTDVQLQVDSATMIGMVDEQNAATRMRLQLERQELQQQRSLRSAMGSRASGAFSSTAAPSLLLPPSTRASSATPGGGGEEGDGDEGLPTAVATHHASTTPRDQWLPIRDVVSQREEHILECIGRAFEVFGDAVGAPQGVRSDGASDGLASLMATFPPPLRAMLSAFGASIHAHLLSSLVPHTVLGECREAAGREEQRRRRDGSARGGAEGRHRGPGGASDATASPTLFDDADQKLADGLLVDELVLAIDGITARGQQQQQQQQAHGRAGGSGGLPPPSPSARHRQRGNTAAQPHLGGAGALKAALEEGGKAQSPLVYDIKGSRLARLVLLDALVIPMLRDPIVHGIAMHQDDPCRLVVPGSGVCPSRGHGGPRRSVSVARRLSRSTSASRLKAVPSSSQLNPNRPSPSTSSPCAAPPTTSAASPPINSAEEITVDDHARRNFFAFSRYFQIMVNAPFASRKSAAVAEAHKVAIMAEAAATRPSEEGGDASAGSGGEESRVAGCCGTAVPPIAAGGPMQRAASHAAAPTVDEDAPITAGDIAECFLGLPSSSHMPCYLSGILNLSTGRLVHRTRFNPCLLLRHNQLLLRQGIDKAKADALEGVQRSVGGRRGGSVANSLAPPPGAVQVSPRMVSSAGFPRDTCTGGLMHSAATHVPSAPTLVLPFNSHRVSQDSAMSEASSDDPLGGGVGGCSPMMRRARTETQPPQGGMSPKLGELMRTATPLKSRGGPFVEGGAAVDGRSRSTSAVSGWSDDDADSLLSVADDEEDVERAVAAIVASTLASAGGGRGARAPLSSPTVEMGVPPTDALHAQLLEGGMSAGAVLHTTFFQQYHETPFPFSITKSLRALNVRLGLLAPWQLDAPDAPPPLPAPQHVHAHHDQNGGAGAPTAAASQHYGPTHAAANEAYLRLVTGRVYAEAVGSAAGHGVVAGSSTAACPSEEALHTPAARLCALMLFSSRAVDATKCSTSQEREGYGTPTYYDERRRWAKYRMPPQQPDSPTNGPRKGTKGAAAAHQGGGLDDLQKVEVRVELAASRWRRAQPPAIANVFALGPPQQSGAAPSSVLFSPLAHIASLGAMSVRNWLTVPTATDMVKNSTESLFAVVTSQHYCLSLHGGGDSAPSGPDHDGNVAQLPSRVAVDLTASASDYVGHLQRVLTSAATVRAVQRAVKQNSPALYRLLMGADGAAASSLTEGAPNAPCMRSEGGSRFAEGIAAVLPPLPDMQALLGALGSDFPGDTPRTDANGAYALQVGSRPLPSVVDVRAQLLGVGLASADARSALVLSPSKPSGAHPHRVNGEGGLASTFMHWWAHMIKALSGKVFMIVVECAPHSCQRWRGAVGGYMRAVHAGHERGTAVADRPGMLPKPRGARRRGAGAEGGGFPTAAGGAMVGANAASPSGVAQHVAGGGGLGARHTASALVPMQRGTDGHAHAEQLASAVDRLLGDRAITDAAKRELRYGGGGLPKVTLALRGLKALDKEHRAAAALPTY